MYFIGGDHYVNGIQHKDLQIYCHRLYPKIEWELPEDQLRHRIYNDVFTGHPIYTRSDTSLKNFLEDCKRYNIVPIVNSNWTYLDQNIPVEEFARRVKIVDDLLHESGFELAYHSIINEPGKYFSTEGYVKIVNVSVDAVSHYQVIMGNDEYNMLDWNYLLDNGKGHILGVHPLSSLGYPANWQILEEWATMATARGKPYMITEGGSWFKSYASLEGYTVIKNLILRAKALRYMATCIVLLDCNGDNYPKLGFGRYNKSYSVKLSTSDYWDDFINLVNREGNKYKGEEPPMADRDLRVIPGYMKGADVTKVQTQLRVLGFDLKADSVYGKITEAAVKKYQQLTGLSQNGIVDDNVREMLEASSVETFYPEVYKGIYESNNYSIEAIDYYLETYAHPEVRGHGKYFVQAEKETGIPAEWQLANGTAESSYKGGGIGSSPIAQRYFNLYGWGIPDSGPTSEGNFDSFKDCILYVQKKIKSLFLDPDNWRYKGDHIFGIEVYYSTAVYNAINKAYHYRNICRFLNAGIKHKVPVYMDALVELLDERYTQK